MWSGGFVWKHFKNNTLCCGDSFQAASSYYGFELWGRQGRPWCGVRPLLFNLSSTPWRPPPSQLSSLHILLHLLPYSSDSHQSSSAAAVCIKKKGGPHCYSPCPLLSLWGLAVIILTHMKAIPNQWGPEDRFFLFVQNQLKSIWEKKGEKKKSVFRTFPSIGRRIRGSWSLKSLQEQICKLLNPDRLLCGFI